MSLSPNPQKLPTDSPDEPFYERAMVLKTVETIKKSMGQKNAYKVEPSYWMLNVDTPVHGTRALAEVHFDSTLLDIELHSSLSGDILGRPWLTLAFCGHTRRVVGMYLSFKPPGYISSMMVLADIAWDWVFTCKLKRKGTYLLTRGIGLDLTSLKSFLG